MDNNKNHPFWGKNSNPIPSNLPDQDAYDAMIRLYKKQEQRLLEDEIIQECGLSPKQAQKRFNMLVKKGISKFVNRPIQNPRGKSWVRKQKMLGENYTEKFWNFGKQLLLERIDFQQVAKQIMRKYRVTSKLEFSPLMKVSETSESVSFLSGGITAL